MTEKELPLNRDFKGIWIPREIWLALDISCQEKCLWAEIHSLFDRDKGGCYASNEYLMEFLGVKERRLQEMMASLKDKGLVVQVSFDGRQRIIKAVLPSENFQETRAGQGCGKVHPWDAEKCTPGMQDPAPLSIYRDKRLDKRIDNTTPTPSKDAPIGARVSDFSSSSKKTKKEKPNPVVKHAFGSHVKLSEEEHATLSQAFGAKTLSTLIDEMNDYCAASKPKGYACYAAALRQWMRQRKGEGVQPKKERKFSPSSNDERSLEKMEKWAEGAL